MRILMTSQFTRWLKRLKDHEGKAVIIDCINRMERTGTITGDCKLLGGNLREMRHHIGPGYRTYLMSKGDVVLLLLLGGTKSSQKRDIARARKLATQWKDVIEHELQP